MIYKELDFDTQNKNIKKLENLYDLSDSEPQKKLIKIEISKLKNGIESEKNAEYYINFYLRDSKHLIVLHDIRLEFESNVAQFDHIIISRFGIDVIETKGLNGELEINNDLTFTVTYGNRKFNYPNPLQQAQRHLDLLKKFLDEHNLLKNKIGKAIEFMPRVLIDPNTVVKNKELPKGFYRSDSFLSDRKKEFDKENLIDTFSSMFSLRTIDTVKEIAELLIKNHTPIEFDYEKKFKIKKIEKPNTETEVALEKQCPRCKEGSLIIRTTKKKDVIEKHGTDKFLGCSRYPKCRYNEKL